MSRLQGVFYSIKWGFMEGEGLEDHFDREEKKQSRIDRRRAQKNDRSFTKKTNQKKKALKPSSLPKGRILAMFGEKIAVDYEGKEILCVVRGSLKGGEKRLKALLAVGDFVHFESISKGEGVITSVAERTSILSRADPLSKRKAHLIAANIDLVLITGSVVSPLLKPPLIDRYLIAAKKGGMEAVIVINKIDLLNGGDEEEQFSKFLFTYRQIGYQVISVSTLTGEGIAALKGVMKGNASVFSGQSGVGKSSLINTICHLNLPTRRVVTKTLKGAHTTTRAQLIPLGEGTFCIDTPGIKSFGIWSLTKSELLSHFPEIDAIGNDCYFNNCSHIHEPDCAVLKELEKGAISPLRYRSYLTLLHELENPHLRR